MFASFRLAGAARHARSAGWGVVEYAAYPLLMLLATPFFVAWLGAPGYGLWVATLAVVWSASVLGLAIAATTTKYVSARRGAGEARTAALIVRQGVAAAALAGLGIAGTLTLAAPWLAAAAPALGPPHVLAPLVRLAAGLVLVQHLELVFAAALKGYERFDVAAPLEVTIRCANVGACLVAAFATRDPVPVLSAGLAAGSLALIVRAAVASRIAGSPVFAPAVPSPLPAGALRFAAWSCVENLSSTAFASLDKIVIGVLLGPTVVSAYAVCTQLAQQVHAIPAAALAFVFPLMSRRAARANGPDPDRLRLAIVLGATTTVSIAALLLAFGGPFLRLWLGSEFARHAAPLLPWLVLGYLIHGLSVAPHYLLLGLGQARRVSLSSIAAGLASLCGTVLLIPSIGAVGGAASRALYGSVLLASYGSVLRGRLR